MRRIVHLSDLHFGKADESLVESLLDAVSTLQPDVVIVSGDLTQRARISQFVRARAFLSRLPKPLLAIPGNHDIPLNPFERFLRPLSKYRRFIDHELEPTYLDDELAVFAINTARRFAGERGSIHARQLARATRFFSNLDHSMLKVVVTHHPFDFPASVAEKYRVRNAQDAMRALAEVGADLFLAGHAHLCFAACSATRFKIAGHSALIVQAGTSISTRTRGEANSFNLVTVARPAITVQAFQWESATSAFVPSTLQDFHHTQEGWRPGTPAS